MKIGLALLAVVAGAACSGAQASDTKVTVDIEHSSFIPSSFTFERGQTITFVVRNRDPIDHEFLIGDEALQRVHEQGTEAHHGARPGEITVPAGETRVTTYTFSDPGPLIVGCHLPNHYAYGMRAAITVE